MGRNTGEDRRIMTRNFCATGSAWRPSVFTSKARYPIYLAISVFGPWRFGDTVRHLVSFAGCDVTRQVGLAGAHRGQPGYWRQHDTNQDGIACGAGDGGE
jgi:hypothetical protein